ncbi:putative Ran-specific GTPase-activating protein 1 [Blattamonas nauphoetae]|uniref:Ran-specific GTPase-activating protein 1 n=1 Tax=Blattamonas nauphoetae TaxID=2049346 RepID=A0ABQ9YHM9_9EUKA|nr:putative Ran-specific GTPase-activating protein 1 [Blattamonas nauphoetae]
MSTVEKTGVDDSYSKSYEPVAHLNEVQLESGEENEELLYKCRAKLLRMDRSLAQPEWRERGVGEVKFLRTKGTEKVRILMRREITLNLCLNHFIAEGLDLTPNPGSDRGWMWRANDFDGEKTSMEIFFIRFNTVERMVFHDHQVFLLQRQLNLKPSLNELYERRILLVFLSWMNQLQKLMIRLMIRRKKENLRRQNQKQKRKERKRRKRNKSWTSKPHLTY